MRVMEGWWWLSLCVCMNRWVSESVSEWCECGVCEWGMWEWVSEGVSEWCECGVCEWGMWEWVSEGEWVSESERVSECEWVSVSGWVEWKSERQWVSEWASQRVSEWVRERESESEWVSVSECEWVWVSVSECEWVSVSVNVSVSVSESESEWVSVCECVCVCFCVCVWESEWVSEWVSEWRQGAHPIPWQCRLSHACHAKQPENKGRQGTPGRTSDPLAVQIAPRRPRKSHRRPRDAKGRQGVHPTSWPCRLSHAGHAKDTGDQGTPRDARAYIRPPGSADCPTPATQKPPETKGRQGTYKATYKAKTGQHTKPQPWILLTRIGS